MLFWCVWTDGDTVYPLVSSCEQHVDTSSPCTGTISSFNTNKILPNIRNALRLMQVCAYASACIHNAQPRATINTSMRGIQSAWCIIQSPPLGGFSQCYYHNVCAQTRLNPAIYMDPPWKGATLGDAHCAHSLPSVRAQEPQRNKSLPRLKLD